MVRCNQFVFYHFLHRLLVDPAERHCGLLDCLSEFSTPPTFFLSSFLAFYSIFILVIFSFFYSLVFRWFRVID